MIVARGGDGFVLSKTFVIPDTSTEVCRTAILEVGTVTVAQPQPNQSAVAYRSGRSVWAAPSFSVSFGDRYRERVRERTLVPAAMRAADSSGSSGPRRP